MKDLTITLTEEEVERIRNRMLDFKQAADIWIGWNNLKEGKRNDPEYKDVVRKLEITNGILKKLEATQ